jgi:hypothetical protein
VQLPFRWLLCMNAALAMLLAMAARRWTWTSRFVASAVLLGAVILAGYRIQPPWWETASDIRDLSDALDDGTGYEGADEYVPTGADPYELNKSLPQVVASYQEAKPTEILQWGSIDKHFVVHTDGLELLTLRLFNYPAWEVTVNGKRVQTQTTEVTGQMRILLMPGTNDVRIHFGRTFDGTVGGCVSLVSLGVLFAAWIRTRLKPTVSSPRQAARLCGRSRALWHHHRGYSQLLFPARGSRRRSNF